MYTIVVPPTEGLVVVDFQNDFLTGSLHGDVNEEALARKINTIREWYPPHHVFFTRDWHPSEMDPHFKKWSPHCVENTWGAEFSSSLVIPPESYVLSKGTESWTDGYSGADAVFETDYSTYNLVELLAIHKLTRVFLVGLYFEYCVYATAKNLRAENFGVDISLDASPALSGEKVPEIRRELEFEGVRIA